MLLGGHEVLIKTPEMTKPQGRNEAKNMEPTALLPRKCILIAVLHLWEDRPMMVVICMMKKLVKHNTPLITGTNLDQSCHKLS